MTNPSDKIRMGWDTERVLTGPFTAGFATIGGPLTVNPVIMIFDNQSNVAVALSVDGVNTWHTFPPGEAITIDCRSNHGIASNYTPSLGTQFYGNANAGAGQFSISILYAE